jgi:hypothetical protein
MSESEKDNTLNSDPQPSERIVQPSVESLKARVIGADADICDQFYNLRGCGQCSTCGALRSEHEPAKRRKADLDVLISAVMAAHQQEIERHKAARIEAIQAWDSENEKRHDAEERVAEQAETITALEQTIAHQDAQIQGLVSAILHVQHTAPGYDWNADPQYLTLLVSNAIKGIDISPYLKDGETPTECIERNRRDVDAVMTSLIREKGRSEALHARLTAVELEQNDHSASLGSHAPASPSKSDWAHPTSAPSFRWSSEIDYGIKAGFVWRDGKPVYFGPGWREVSREEMIAMLTAEEVAKLEAAERAGSGTQATKEHADATRRSAAPKPSSSPSLTPVDQQTWQPIKTAPKDGTLILGWNGECHLIWYLDIGRGEAWVNAATAYELKRDKQPTHWLPLPDPPLPAVDQPRTAHEHD